MKVIFPRSRAGENGADERGFARHSASATIWPRVRNAGLISSDPPLRRCGRTNDRS